MHITQCSTDPNNIVSGLRFTTIYFNNFTPGSASYYCFSIANSYSIIIDGSNFVQPGDISRFMSLFGIVDITVINFQVNADQDVLFGIDCYDMRIMNNNVSGDTVYAISITVCYPGSYQLLIFYREVRCMLPKIGLLQGCQ